MKHFQQLARLRSASRVCCRSCSILSAGCAELPCNAPNNLLDCAPCNKASRACCQSCFGFGCKAHLFSRLASAARRSYSAARASAASPPWLLLQGALLLLTWFQLQGAIFCRLDFCSMPLSCRYSPRGPWNYAVVHVKFLEACLRQRTRVVDALEKRSLSMVACTAASIFSLSPPLSLFFSLSSFRVLHIMEQ